MSVRHVFLRTKLCIGDGPPRVELLALVHHKSTIIVFEINVVAFRTIQLSKQPRNSASTFIIVGVFLCYVFS